MTKRRVLIAAEDLQYRALFEKPAFSEFECLGVATTKEDAERRLFSDSADILVASDGLPSSKGITTEDFLLTIKRNFPELRIIFLAGETDSSDIQRLSMLGSFAASGIYDFYTRKTITADGLLDLLNNPRNAGDVAEYMQYYQPNGNADHTVSNLIVCSSVKPGTGKSTLAVNIAAAIARYGQLKPNSKAPRVAIVEGDLSSLSLGLLLKVENTQYNLKKALMQVRTVVDPNGVIVGTDEQLASVKKDVRACFVKYPELNNLYAMVTSELGLTDLMKISPSQYYYMIQCITGAFDVVIVDANSSLEHRTTGPLLEMASRCFFVLDLDYNDIQNNLRYMRELNSLGISGKIHYILNKDIDGMDAAQHLEDLNYSISDFEQLYLNIDQKIPMIDKGIMMNHEFSGKPIVLDDTPELYPYKKAFLDVANEIWKINYQAAEEDSSGKKKKKKKTSAEDTGKKAVQMAKEITEEGAGTLNKLISTLNK